MPKSEIADGLFNTAQTEECELSDSQRGKLLEFIERFDQCFSDGSFDEGNQLTDVELLALALRAAEILGYEGKALERFFEREFDVSGLGNEGPIGDVLAIAMRVDIEQRIRCAGGGRN